MSRGRVAACRAAGQHAGIKARRAAPSTAVSPQT